MLTGVVLARNEERNIVACLEALRPHVSELLLIDMESADRTAELARPFVRRILHHPHIPNFDSARNIAIAEATNEWMWFVDADERISSRLGQLINQLVRQNGCEFEAILIPFRSYFCGQWMQHCGWWPGYTMPRVLKRGFFEFAEKLHGGVQQTGRSIRLPPDPELAIDHFSYESIEHYVEKLNRYTSTEAMQMAESGVEHDWRQAARHMVFDLWQYYERNNGREDGIRGWILSWLSGQYRWLSHAKLIDCKPPAFDAPDQVIPNDLDEVFQFMEHILAECRAPTPRIPLGIVWRGPLWDPSGYADESRAFVKALSASEREFCVQDIHWATQECELPARDRALFRALSNSIRPRYTATITNCIPTVATTVPATSLNILRTTFETDRLPENWLLHIAAYDETWVISQHNYRTFLRSGVPPEKLRVVPSCIDLELFTPEGSTLDLPSDLDGRFVFLTVFDWGLRKGWDVLIKSYARSFTSEDGAGLLLKITRNHGHSMETVRASIDRVLASCQQSLATRKDIVIWEAILSASELASLYRSADAFVLASRGEGWGRPYMEAMASGLPTIGTYATGNGDFMNDANSFLVPSQEVDVPIAAAQEIPTYHGHRWYEPDAVVLGQQLRRVFDEPSDSKQRAAIALQDVQTKYNLENGRRGVERALKAAEARFHCDPIPEVRSDQIRVEIEGELFAGHSFSKINEILLCHFSKDERFALSFHRVFHTPVNEPHAPNRTTNVVDRRFADGPHVTVRHAFPPNWQKPTTGKWVHIQPFEFGYLPEEWVPPLRDDVDEIWAPSNYVRDLYLRSGVPKTKIHVLPWGVDTDIYHQDAVPLLLPTRRTFRFLYVGGTILRKGFDRVLAAYLEEFTRHDDVSLIVKGLGDDTFYRFGNMRSELLQAQQDPSKAEIVLIDKFLTEGQMPSLYAACDCLVAPYRGEGFGLPVLEAMACGIPSIVPRGGATDDFVSETTGFLLNAELRPTEHEWKLAGPCLELEVRIPEIKSAMRRAFESRDVTDAKGRLAASWVDSHCSWAHTINKMASRIQQLVGPKIVEKEGNKKFHFGTSDHGQFDHPKSSVTIGIVLKTRVQQLPDCLSRLRALSENIIVFDQSRDSRAPAIATEYGVQICSIDRSTKLKDIRKIIRGSATGEWTMVTRPDVSMTPEVASDIRKCLDGVPARRKSADYVLEHRTTNDAKGRRVHFERV